MECVKGTSLLFSPAIVPWGEIAMFDLLKDTIYNLVARNVVPGLDEIAIAVYPKKIFPLATRNAFSELKKDVERRRNSLTWNLRRKKADELLNMKTDLQSQFKSHRIATIRIIDTTKSMYNVRDEFVYCAVTEALVNCGLSEIEEVIKDCKLTSYHWYVMDENNLTHSRIYVLSLLISPGSKNQNIENFLNPPENYDSEIGTPKNEAAVTKKKNVKQTVFLDETSSTTDVKSEEPSLTNKENLPIIVFKLMEDWNELQMKFKEKFHHEFCTKSKNKKFKKLYVNSRHDLEEAVKIMRSCGTEFYFKETINTTYPSLVLKNLPSDIGSRKLKEELLKKQIQSFEVEQLKNPSGVSLSMYLVIVKDNESEKRLKELNSLFETDIQIESYKPERKVLQCQRCQRFNHKADRCNMKFRCSICGENHMSLNCQLPKDHQAFCVNCNKAGHRADHESCKNYPKFPTEIIKFERKVCDKVCNEIANRRFTDIQDIAEKFSGLFPHYMQNGLSDIFVEGINIVGKCEGNNWAQLLAVILTGIKVYDHYRENKVDRMEIDEVEE